MTFHSGWLVVLLLIPARGPVSAQFIDEFDGPISGSWTWFTGDGLAEMTFSAADGHATISVDASRDTTNVWWALIKRDVSPVLDLELLSRPDYEIRIEARIRVSHAPRRVNLHVNTQRTTDFHTHLMEYDIPDSSGWHAISMTTNGFDARPGDAVNAQMALMDWGTGHYTVDIDYFRVDVVDTRRASPDLGMKVPYHPPVPPESDFEFRLAPSWRSPAGTSVDDGIRITPTRDTALFWNFASFEGRRVSGPGLLKLTAQVHSAESAPEGLLRIAEAGNPQMIIDVALATERGEPTFATISAPALNRLLNGDTPGLELRSLHGLEVTLCNPVLFFNTQGGED